MNPLVIDIAIAAGSLALFAACFVIALLATQSGRPRRAAATPDLGEESPAVVNLLATGWRLNEDAVEATLLDLAARRHLELRQPGNDPMHTTIHLRAAEDVVPGELTDYEQRVLDRVRGLAVDGVVPVTALTFRNERLAKTWERRFHQQVVTDARRRGLSRRRFGPAVVSLLGLVAALATLGLVAAAARWEMRWESAEDEGGVWLLVGFAAFSTLSGMVGAVRGERSTAAGLNVASTWLGVREWLRRHEEFADLPPAAVMVWDRYLPYGAALGVTHTTSAVLDLGMGNRTLVWSSHGGSWRRVKVRYPRFWSHYGKRTGRLLRGVAWSLGVGAGLVWLHGKLPSLALADLFDTGVTRRIDDVAAVDVTGQGMLALGVALIVWGGYRTLRILVDLGTTRTITGQVLWCETWRAPKRGSSGTQRPALYHLAVDDGSADKTAAWMLPDMLAGRCTAGDSVTIRVRPWTRRVIGLSNDQRGSRYELAKASANEADPEAPGHLARPGFGAVGALLGQRQGKVVDDATTMLTADEVATAVGIAVRMPVAVPTPAISTATFANDQGKPVLLVQVARGIPGRLAWSASSRGTALPGVGDGAFFTPERAVARIGDATVVVTLTRDGNRAQPDLTGLLRHAASRVAHLEQQGS